MREKRKKQMQWNVNQDIVKEVIVYLFPSHDQIPTPAIADLRPPKDFCNVFVLFWTPCNALVALVASTVSFTLACATNKQ